MAQLLVRDIPETLVKQLKRRAVEHGVSAEEEHRRILREVLEQTAAPQTGKEYTLLDHLRQLGELAPDIDFTRPRTRSQRRKLDF